jgi:SHS2 domain-containing protein
MSGLAPSNANTARWEHFPHGADIGVRDWGATPAEAFAQAAHAVTAIVTHADVKPSTAVEVRCEAPDVELLFVEWLNAIIYEMAVRAMLFARFVVCIDGDKLIGTLWGEPVDVARHAPACEPKGATYTALKVSRAADGQWSVHLAVGRTRRLVYRLATRPLRGKLSWSFSFNRCRAADRDSCSRPAPAPRPK